MSKENIMVIKICKRRDTADSIQKVLTEFGCIIQTRLGLHEAGSVCSDKGLIILQLVDDAEKTKSLEEALGKLDGITFKSVQL